MRKIKLLSSILTLIIIIISGCSSSSTSKSELGNEKYFTGNQGIVLNFLQDAPPTKLFEGDDLVVMIQYFNKGATDVNGGTIYLTGYDTKYITLSPSQININAVGKSINNPDGNIPYIQTSKSNSIRMPEDTDSFRQKIQATACYQYKTIASAEICIAPNAFTTMQNPVCTVKPVISLAGGQGGPVAVTKVEQEIMGNRVQFKIFFQNTGGGTVIDQYAISNCHTSLDIQDVDKVDIIRASFSDKTLTCQPDNPIMLQNGQGFVYCYYNGDIGDSAYITQLKVELEYGYRNSIEKEITIYDLPGS